MTEDNVMEFCQWLVSEKGIEAGNLSDYINNNEEEVLKLAQEFKKPKFKVGGKVEAAAEMFKCGGKTEEKQDGGKMSRKEYKANKTSRKDLKNAANDRGYSDDQFSKSYYTLKDSFRNNGLSRRNAKLAAQRVIMGDNTAATPVDVAPTEPIYSYSRPSAPAYSWEPDKFYEGFDDMQFEIIPVRRKATAKSAVTKRDPLVFSEIVTPSMNNTNSFASFINPLNNKIYLRNNSVPSDIIDGGVMEDITVTAPGIVDGGMIDDVVVTAPGKSSKKPNFRTNTMPGRFGLAHYACGGKAKNKIKKHADGNPLTLGPIKIDDDRDGYVSYNNDGSVKSSIYRRTEPWQGTYQPSMALTHRVTSPDSVAMYVQYGPADEESRRGYLYNTARHMGAREIANREKFDQMFNDLESKAGMRVVALPNNKYVIRDVVHTPDDTMTRVVDPEKQDTVIMTQDLKRYSNKDIGTRIKRAVGLESKFDKLNKLFKEFDFEFKYGGALNNINKK